MAVWYSSDLHFGHRLVAGIRGFGTPGAVTPDQAAEHDEHLIARWNEAVQPGDEAWILGDLTLRDPASIWHLVDRLNGTKHLVLGNHDAAFAGHRGHHRHQRAYLDHFASVHDIASRRLEGQQVILSHFPYTGDRGEDRCKPFRPRDERLVIIHGHTHLPQRWSLSELGTLQIHAGLDAWDLSPVPEPEILKMIRDRKEIERLDALMSEDEASW